MILVELTTAQNHVIDGQNMQDKNKVISQKNNHKNLETQKFRWFATNLVASTGQLKVL